MADQGFGVVVRVVVDFIVVVFWLGLEKLACNLICMGFFGKGLFAFRFCGVVFVFCVGCCRAERGWDGEGIYRGGGETL